jgi:hypothetical protein
MNGEFVAPDRRPTATGSVISLLFFLAGVTTLADDATQLVVVTVEAGCLLCIGTGRFLQGQEYSYTGRSVVFVGFLSQLLAVGAAASIPERLDEQVVLVVGLFGVIFCLLSLYPLRRQYSRQFLNVGTGICILAIFVSAILREASVLRIAVASTATLVGLNIGKQSITLGERVGRAAETKRIEWVRTLGNVSVGTVLIASVAIGNVVVPTKVPTLTLTLLLATIIILLSVLIKI